MNKSKILVVGCTGLLGSMVTREFVASGYEVCGTFREYDHVQNIDCKFHLFDGFTDDVFLLPSQYDYIINCIGLIKPHLQHEYATYHALKLNAAFPHELAYFAQRVNSRVIHITSDCVFTGSRGNYTEDDEHDMIDLYGRTKSLGETDKCMVLRTSFIGPEVHSHVSLMDWVKSNDNNTIDGYTNHIWNGVTTKQLACICKKIIEEDLYNKDLYHVFSPDTVTKFELVSMIAESLKLNIQVKPTRTDISINRSLGTVKALNDRLNIPSLKYQLDTL